jgi:hypothetical protein
MASRREGYRIRARCAKQSLKDSGRAHLWPGSDVGPVTDAARRPTEIEPLEARREHFDQIFARLEAEGIARADLVLAFDFVVRSDLLSFLRSRTWKPLAITAIRTSPTHSKLHPPHRSSSASSKATARS